MITKRILVTGFPHCGTTILRAKIGECKSVFDQHKEFGDSADYFPDMGYKWYVWKHPFLHSIFRNNTFKAKAQSNFADIIVIPIIRNPWYVFTSLKKRGEKTGEFDIRDGNQGHSLPYYFNAAEVFLDAVKNRYPNVYPIRYEDMFINNYAALRNVFDCIGLEYDENIFTTKTKTYLNNESEYIENLQDFENVNGNLRIWQINQNFENFNKNVDIPDDISDILTNHWTIKELGYSDPRVTN